MYDRKGKIIRDLKPKKNVGKEAKSIKNISFDKFKDDLPEDFTAEAKATQHAIVKS